MRLESANTLAISTTANAGSVSMRSILGAGERGVQGLPGPGAAAWAPADPVTTGTVRQAPDGSRIKSLASRTTGATFDATEQTFWKSVAATPGTIEASDLSATYVRVRTSDGLALPPDTVVVLTIDKTLAEVTADPTADINDITFEGI